MSKDTQLSDSDGVVLVKTARKAVTEFLSNGEDSIGSPNIFLNKRNFKWYGLIVVGFGLAYTAQFL